MAEYPISVADLESIGRPMFPRFERDILLSEVNPDETDPDRIAAAAFTPPLIPSLTP